MRRALSFQYLMEHKAICINEGELIVGEKGPAPKATPTYPEITCHSVEDLEILVDVLLGDPIFGNGAAHHAAGVAPALEYLDIDPDVVETERGAVMSERRQGVDDSHAGLLYEQMYANAYVAHPYQNPIIGWPSDIENWTQEDLEAIRLARGQVVEEGPWPVAHLLDADDPRVRRRAIAALRAAKARETARSVLDRVRSAVGLGNR